MAMHSIIKAPLAICAQSVLAAANLAVQGHADVVIDGRWFPVSEYFLSIAQSGERKSAADKAALSPVDAHQRYLLEAYSHDSSQYALEAALWKKEYEDALRKKDPAARRVCPGILAPRSHRSAISATDNRGAYLRGFGQVARGGVAYGWTIFQ